MGPAEMQVIASLIARVVAAPGDTSVRASVRGAVRTLARSFPLYPVQHLDEPMPPPA
jgi:glycine/serine hydroxymethyltransferase